MLIEPPKISAGFYRKNASFVSGDDDIMRFDYDSQFYPKNYNASLPLGY